MTPSPQQIAALRAQARRAVPWIGGRAAADEYPGSYIPGPPLAIQRKRSRLFARLMRERGWLAEEGYAPGSWAGEP